MFPELTDLKQNQNHRIQQSLVPRRTSTSRDGYASDRHETGTSMEWLLGIDNSPQHIAEKLVAGGKAASLAATVSQQTAHA